MSCTNYLWPSGSWQLLDRAQRKCVYVIDIDTSVTCIWPILAWSRPILDQISKLNCASAATVDIERAPIAKSTGFIQLDESAVDGNMAKTPDWLHDFVG